MTWGTGSVQRLDELPKALRIGTGPLSKGEGTWTLVGALPGGRRLPRESRGSGFTLIFACLGKRQVVELAGPSLPWEIGSAPRIPSRFRVASIEIAVSRP